MCAVVAAGTFQLISSAPQSKSRILVYDNYNPRNDDLKFNIA